LCWCQRHPSIPPERCYAFHFGPAFVA
jgi:hypothetical protein